MTIFIRQATKSGYIEMCNGGVCDLSEPNSATRRGRVQGGHGQPDSDDERKQSFQDNGVLV